MRVLSSCGAVVGLEQGRRWGRWRAPASALPAIEGRYSAPDNRGQKMVYLPKSALAHCRSKKSAHACIIFLRSAINSLR